jgi:ribose-phosphate pyrophosphokinase
MEVIGEVKNKHVIIVDDMIDTAGTIVKASEMMLEKGALSVRALATHPVFSGKAYERLEQSPLEEIVVTDTLPLKRTDVNKIKVVSCAPLFAKVMNKVHVNETISGIFLM